MITVELARALLAEGVLWEPRAGDRFVIDRSTLHSDVFWVSDLTIELHHFGGQSVLGFNGTTEWALDSVDLDQALWLPREDQLRDLLGDRLVRLEPRDGAWSVGHVLGDGSVAEVIDEDVECAYARALLAALSREGG
jgi:hypothetical protein